MKQAILYVNPDNKKLTVQCRLCSHYCIIKNGSKGRCKVRKNIEGKLYTLVYDRIVSCNADPIEKKPIFHILPGSKSLSIATFGCNFRCLHCQNFEISQYPLLKTDEITGHITTPDKIIATALAHQCDSISYTYIEPTIFIELALDTMKLAHKHGLKNIFVSNGYTSPEAVTEIAPYLDANNIDLKAFTDKFYREVCRAKLAPVLQTIELMKQLNIWLEITTLIIPGWNDSKKELSSIAQYINNIDPEIPWHVSRFHPTYKMTDHPPTPIETILNAKKIGETAGLRYVYTGNIAGHGGEDTLCPHCGDIIIKRTSYSIIENKIASGACSSCSTSIPGIWH